MLRRRERGNRAGMENFRPAGARLSVFRAMMRAISALGRTPKGVRSVKDRFGDGLAGTWFLADGANECDGVLLYVHGGGFVLPPVHTAPAAKYSAATGLAVFLPRYRLAPEHPFPAAAEDLLAAYRYLLDRGTPPEKIRLAGDSSGGFLVLTLLGDLERSGFPMPGPVLLLSPLVDLSGRSARERDETRRDPATASGFIEVTGAAYAGGTPVGDPRLDVLAADKRAWPPVLIQTGDTECLVPENQRLAESIRAAGRPCELQVWPGQIHGFALLDAAKLPEARAATDYAARFLTTPPVRPAI